MRVIRLACLVITSALLACGGGGDDDDGGTTGPPPPPPGGGGQTLGSITTNVSSLTLIAGATQTITVTALDAAGAVIANPGAPNFASATPSIAEVDASGNVLAISSGTTTITAQLTVGSVTRTAPVTVNVTGSLPANGSVSTTAGDAFTPNRVAIIQGGSVTWQFGVTIHNVTFNPTAGTPANVPDSYSISASRSFNTSGNFAYTCTLHPGMSGTVIVR
jgi:plastocyanin